MLKCGCHDGLHTVHDKLPNDRLGKDLLPVWLQSISSKSIASMSNPSILTYRFAVCYTDMFLAVKN